MPCLVLPCILTNTYCMCAYVCVCVSVCLARLCVPVIMCYIIFYGHNRRSYIFCFYFQVYQTGNARVASSTLPYTPPLPLPACRLFVFNLVLMPSSIIVKIITLNVNAEKRVQATDKRRHNARLGEEKL